jgi:hypothetical protein
MEIKLRHCCRLNGRFADALPEGWFLSELGCRAPPTFSSDSWSGRNLASGVSDCKREDRIVACVEAVPSPALFTVQ